jgi:hypothetical protein
MVVDQVTATLNAQNHPRLAGPVALRRTQPDTYTVTARLDQLTGQQQRLGQAQRYRHPLTAEQAHMLLAALAPRRTSSTHEGSIPGIHWRPIDYQRSLGMVTTM